MDLVPRRLAALLTALLAALASSLLLAGPASAARTVDVVLTADAPAPMAIAPGDSVRFVNGESGPLAPPHAVRAVQQDGSTAWQYESGPIAPGAASAPVVFPAAGTYLFVDRRGGAVLASEVTGRVVVTAPAAASPRPAPAPAAPSPAAAPPPADTAGLDAPAAPPAEAPVAASDLPPLVSGLEAPPAPLDEPLVPPSVALPGTAAPTPAARREVVAAEPGPLPGVGTSRGVGLPATLAALAVVGVASLLARVLLAEPAAQPGAPRPVAASL